MTVACICLLASLDIKNWCNNWTRKLIIWNWSDPRFPCLLSVWLHYTGTHALTELRSHRGWNPEMISLLPWHMASAQALAWDSGRTLPLLYPKQRFTLRASTHLKVSGWVSSSWPRGSESRSMMHSNSCRSSNSRRSIDMCWHIASSSFPCSGVKSSRSSFSTLSKASCAKRKETVGASDQTGLWGQQIRLPNKNFWLIPKHQTCTCMDTIKQQEIGFQSDHQKFNREFIYFYC